MRPNGRAILLVLMSATLASAEDAETRFETKVRPTLAGTCFACHGGKKTSAGLRLDSREALLKGGDSGPSIVPGDPAGSLLIQALRQTHESVKMPPSKKLDPALVQAFEQWVKEGAVWPKGSGTGAKDFVATRHWAFEPVKPVRPPAGSATHPIDRFVDATRRAAGLASVGPADRRTLIRRLSFDLIGLPPTPEETEAFLADSSPDAYERLVDRLLASPHYGERWGRHWLDLARYADTAGDNADYPVPELVRYRDYVIKAFNRDMPYDRFVREQIAGDVIARDGPAEAYADAVVATGFLALSRRYATGPYELWHLSLEDAIDTTGRVFMGMTMRCARCHDHKFDPITQKDYYAMYGAFASTTFPYAGSEEFQSMSKPRQGFASLLPPAVSEPKLKAHRERIAGLEAKMKEADAEVKKAAGEAKKAAQTKLELAKAEFNRAARLGFPPDVPGAYAVAEGTPVDVPIQRKGDPGDSGAVVPRGAPGFLATAPAPKVAAKSSGRRELAEWLTRPDHPLTARVIVNRVWQYHFGRGIVATSGIFGLRGEPPSHPELLDWLAARFVAEGWSIKALHRLIVTSETYRQASAFDSSNDAKDPSNRLLWRFDRSRLDAESIRDAMLVVSGRLDLSTPGPHPFPSIELWNWTQHNAFKESYPSNRRTVYLMTQRLQRNPFLALFDGPDTNASTDVRTRATIPLQTLYLMNNPFVKTQAESFADRLKGDARAKVKSALVLAWNRPPTAEELASFTDFVARFEAEAKRSGLPADQASRAAWTSFARTVLTANEFLYVD